MITINKKNTIKHLKNRRKGILSSFTFKDLENPVTKATVTEGLEMLDKQSIEIK